MPSRSRARPSKALVAPATDFSMHFAVNRAVAATDEAERIGERSSASFRAGGSRGEPEPFPLGARLPEKGGRSRRRLTLRSSRIARPRIANGSIRFKLRLCVAVFPRFGHIGFDFTGCSRIVRASGVESYPLGCAGLRRSRTRKPVRVFKWASNELEPATAACATTASGYDERSTSARL